MLDQPKRHSMDSKNILGNEAAMAVLHDAATRLRAIGVSCVVSPMSLPQGMSVSLHIGATNEVATAAEVAATCGGEYAHAVGTSKQFAQMVTHAIADAAQAAPHLEDVHADAPDLDSCKGLLSQKVVMMVDENSAWPSEALSAALKPDFSSDAFNKQVEREISRNGLIGPRDRN